MSGEEYSDENHLLRSSNDITNDENAGVSAEKDNDLEAQEGLISSRKSSISPTSRRGGVGGFKDLLIKHLDGGGGLSGRRLNVKRGRDNSPNHDGREIRDQQRPPVDHHHHHNQQHHESSAGIDGNDELADSAPPEWALLLLGCLLGLATGLLVAAFNKGVFDTSYGSQNASKPPMFNPSNVLGDPVHVIHEWAWAGTPSDGAAWLRLQRLGDTWHRILLIPVTGGVIVGMMHGLLEILGQIRQSGSSQRQGFDLLAAVFPSIKAVQAAVTLGTGCSLGPEGPSVDIGKSCANGISLMMENNRERKIALVAAGAAAGISSGFNAAVAGCFFAIETVLRPLRAENSPPFTTAMIILASVISSTVSNVLQGTQSAFTVPTYDLKSAAVYLGI
ncbi:hypothetical protein C1H46_045041 [Malus baccata]|uniref:Chloride channel protein n=1 Tax=Malus baccata TaxID=106549 RepID=A0A540K5B5_MALBA|nr:hypothetical protein C1H46_045041 [Malus baccata]